MSDSDTETFHGDIVVGSRIIDYLSSGLYESPASCLKELVNNSYDADAKTVHVLVKPDADTIAIEDDGLGMTKDDFVRHFGRISESYKREGNDHTPSGRPKIGKIGIGFIAANELCDVMEIYSTVKGSEELLHVVIDFGVMRNPDDLRRVEGDEEGFKKGDYAGEVSLDVAASEHFTKIYLKKIRGPARESLVGAAPPLPDMRAQTIYGLRPETIRDRLANLDTWSSLDDYSRTRLGVALNVPVAYPERWVPESSEGEVSRFTKRIDGLGFEVIYDGSRLEKPVVLDEQRDRPGHLLRTYKFEGERVALEGYLFARHGILKPTEMNGVLIRIRNAAVGEYVRDFIDFPSGTGQLFQRWVSGEIYADDRLEEALNIDRKTLRETHPAYVELKQWLHATLTSFLSETRNVLYQRSSEERAVVRTERSAKAIRDVADAASKRISPEVGNAIRNAWTPEPTAKKAETKRFDRNYSVAEFYDIATEIAAEVLPAEQAAAFIEALNRRLSG